MSEQNQEVQWANVDADLCWWASHDSLEILRAAAPDIRKPSGAVSKALLFPPGILQWALGGRSLPHTSENLLEASDRHFQVFVDSIIHRNCYQGRGGEARNGCHGDTKGPL